MVRYSAKGVHKRGRVIPWDRSKRIRYKLPPHARVVRYTLEIRPEHVPFTTWGVGPITKRDVGKLLVVDERPRGRGDVWIDHLVEASAQPFGRRG